MTKQATPEGGKQALPFSPFDWMKGDWMKGADWMKAADWMNGGAAATAMGRANEVCSQACQEWQQALTRFMTDRAQADSQHMQRLAACQNWMDAMRLQQEYTMTAVQDYAREAQNLMQLASRLGSRVMAASGNTSLSAAAE